MKPKPPLDPRIRFEFPDPTPMSVTSGLKRPPTLEETVARIARDHQAKVLLASRFKVKETDEEAEDFDVGDVDDLPLSKYELAADAVPAADVKRRLMEAVSEKPTLREYVDRMFGHLFRGGRVPVAKPPAEVPTVTSGAKAGGPPVAEVKP